jgi:hypothetical protein
MSSIFESFSAQQVVAERAKNRSIQLKIYSPTKVKRYALQRGF